MRRVYRVLHTAQRPAQRQSPQIIAILSGGSVICDLCFAPPLAYLSPRPNQRMHECADFLRLDNMSSVCIGFAWTGPHCGPLAGPDSAALNHSGMRTRCHRQLTKCALFPFAV